jgi:Cu+-exporting ATPase
LRVLLNTTIAAACFAVPTFLISMVFMMFLPDGNSVRQWLMTQITPGLSREVLISFILATPVQFIIGSRFYIGAYKSLVKTRSANMDVLVALGTSAAYFYSVGAVVAAMIEASDKHVSIFFETSVLLIFFILLGKYLESNARGI